MTVCAQWRSSVSVGINGGAKRVDALNHRAIGFVDLEDRSALAGIIDNAIGQNSVIHRLPEVIQRPCRKPVSVEGPYLHEIAALPGIFILVPALRAVGAGTIRAVFGFDEYVISVHQGNLVVDAQTAKSIGIIFFGV